MPWCAGPGPHAQGPSAALLSSGRPWAASVLACNPQCGLGLPGGLDECTRDGARRVRTSHTVAGRGLTLKGPEPFCRTLFPWSAWGFPGGTAQGEVSLADTQCSLHRRLAPAASRSLPWGRRRREEGKGVRDQPLCIV